MVLRENNVFHHKYSKKHKQQRKTRKNKRLIWMPFFQPRDVVYCTGTRELHDKYKELFPPGQQGLLQAYHGRLQGQHKHVGQHVDEEYHT